MALSNWDTAALDEQSRPTNGVFVSPVGISVRIYKSWLYIDDPAGWRPKGSFTEPTVAQINDGSLWYKDVKIRAWRGPSDGIYVVVWSGYDKNIRCMVGCGVYGFLDNGEWTGVTDEHIEFLKKKIPPPLNFPSPPDPTWGGTQGEEQDQKIQEYFDMVSRLNEAQEEGLLDNDTIRKLGLDFSKMLRFNQGDAYFAARFGHATESVATPVGQEKPPMLIRALKKKEVE